MIEHIPYYRDNRVHATRGINPKSKTTINTLLVPFDLFPVQTKKKQIVFYNRIGLNFALIRSLYVFFYILLLRLKVLFHFFMDYTILISFIATFHNITFLYISF